MPIPTDKEVRVGRLDNGLSYYLRHNETPKRQADFYLALKSGSMDENDDQQGLAHFLEHMAFNGTRHFPGNSIIEWLEKTGVKFGKNFNAKTGWDRTIYNISNVPLTRKSVQDSCLLILRDWSDGLSLLPEEIDAERQVIQREWRARNTGSQRILEKLLPVMMQGSRYGQRFPIGSMEIIKNITSPELQECYRDWYRPDRQAIIIVGDIDVDSMEIDLKKMFGSIPYLSDNKAMHLDTVPDNKGTIYAIGIDKELPLPQACLYFKVAPIPATMKTDAMYLGMKYMYDVLVIMLNSRLSDLSAKADAPFAASSVTYGNFLVSTKNDALQLCVTAKDKDIRPALSAAFRELIRAQRHGFTDDELQRAKNIFMSSLEKRYNDRGHRNNGEYIVEYLDNFFDNEPIMSVDNERKIIQLLSTQMPIMAFNSVISKLITPDNRVAMVTIPDKEGYYCPSSNDIDAVIKSVEKELVEAYMSDFSDDPLMKTQPLHGQILSENVDTIWHATRMELSNGATVIIKPTDFKSDEILFAAEARGGTSTIDDIYSPSLQFMPVTLQKFGIGNFSNNRLKKHLSGNQVSIEINFLDYIREISGASSVADLSILMQMIHLVFTDLNLDSDEFTSMQESYAALLSNRNSMPDAIFMQHLDSVLYKNPRKQFLTDQIVKSAKREEIIDICRRMTANAADFTFIFVGNIDIDTTRPLIEQYIASLPGNKSNSSADVVIDTTLEISDGVSVDNFLSPMTTPQTWIAATMTGSIPYSLENKQLIKVASAIISRRLLDRIREEMGAAYTVGANGVLSSTGKTNAMISSVFPIKPQFKDDVLDVINDEFRNPDIKIAEEELHQAVTYLTKTIEEARMQNSGWIDAIGGYILSGVNTFHPALNTLSSITISDVENFRQQLINCNNYHVITLSPQE